MLPTRRHPWTVAEPALAMAAMLVASAACAADVTSTWDGSTGDWSDVTRWDSVEFPDNGNGGFTFDAVIGGGVVTLDQDIVIDALTFSGGTIDGGFDLTLANGASNWGRGTMSGSGTTTLASGATLDIPFVTNGNQTLARRLVNEGEVGLTTALRLGDGVVPSVTLENAAGGVFNIGNGGSVSNLFSATADATFQNAGLLNKTGSGTASFSSGVVLNNSGTVDVQEGSLILNDDETAPTPGRSRARESCASTRGPTTWGPLPA